jgi:G3E family GTPase
MTPRLMLVGGFLGAGKTTLLMQAAQQLAAQGHRVGLITNDQGSDLVDSALLRQQAIPVVEVAGGCFCCRFPDLLLALQQLQQTVNPDVILAEPVGSCTDLMATVLRPLMAYHPTTYTIAPLTVLLDATRQPAAYTSEVNYLYQKQLAEAELMVISKADLLEPAAATEQARRLHQQYAPVQVMQLSAQRGDGVADWLEIMLTQSSQLVKTLELDYTRYAVAEAQLGWLNLKGTLQGQQPFMAKHWLTHLLHTLDYALRDRNAAIAHVKVQAQTSDAVFKASLIQSGGPISWDLAPLAAPSQQLDFLLNARVHTTPALLEQIVRWAFAEMTPAPDFRYEFSHFECFSPAPPQPTHRLHATP